MNVDLRYLVIAWVVAAFLCVILLKPIRNFAPTKNIADSPNIARKTQGELIPDLCGVGIFINASLFMLFGTTTRI